MTPPGELYRSRYPYLGLEPLEIGVELFLGVPWRPFLRKIREGWRLNKPGLDWPNFGSGWNPSAQLPNHLLISYSF